MECTVRDVGNMLNILGTAVSEPSLIQHFDPKSRDPGEPVPEEARYQLGLGLGFGHILIPSGYLNT